MKTKFNKECTYLVHIQCNSWRNSFTHTILATIFRW